MRRQLSNSIYGLLDYAAYPIGMLAVAPIVLRNLGVAQYGVWTVTTAIVSLGSIVASGFGDANLQQVATQRGGQGGLLLRTVRATMGIHLVLGVGMALLFWALAPYLAGRLALADGALKQMCLSCIRIAGLLTLVRAVETVCISTQRAFERYGAAVRISVAGRILGLAAAALLASASFNVTVIVAASAAFAAFGLLWQFVQLQQLLRAGSLAPSFDRAATRELLQFGVFTWILAATGVVFSQADRLIGGTSMGASAVVSYALCAQISQPLYGLTAAGLHFLFPYIARQRVSDTAGELRQTVVRAVLANILLVCAGAGLLLIFSNRILQMLATDEIARACAPLLLPVLASSALLALNVSGVYAMLALGKAKAVALVNVAGAVAMVLVIAWLLPGHGITAIVGARLAFAVVALLVYIPLIRELRFGAFRFRHIEAHLAAGEGA